MKTGRICGPAILAAMLAVILLADSAARGEMVTRRWGKADRGLGGAARPQAGKAAPAAASVGYCPLVSAAPEVDGKLTDACWAEAPPMALAKTLDGSAPAAQPTEVRAVRTDKALYLAFRCAEPAIDKVRAPQRNHDGDIWNDDSVEAFLGFGEVYYHFGVNAAGGTYDGKGKDAAWNSAFKAAAVKGEKEWTVEMSIPLEKLTGQDKVPEEWIANFNRSRYAGGELQETAWSPTFSGDSHAREWFGKLRFASPPKEAQAPATAPAGKQAMEVLPCKQGVAVLRFDLSDLPKGAAIYRADLFLVRTRPITGCDEEAMVDLEVSPLFEDFAPGTEAQGQGQALAVRPPWFDCLDATEAVRAWAGGKPNGGFFVKACPLLDAQAAWLEVAYEGRPQAVPAQASDLRAFHRAGQTFITWKEIDEPVGTDEVRWGQFRTLLENLDQARRVRYCLYRFDKPITPASIHQAERIATVAPLSCWNVNGRNADKPIDDMLGNQYWLNHHQWNPFVQASADGKFGVDCLMERLAVRDGEPPRARGTGLHVHTPGLAGKAYYAVLTSVDGVQNAADISAANSLAAPVEETAGAGEPVLQKEFAPKPFFNYREKRYHYVQWVAPPLVNLPSQYYNWGVGVPLNHDRAMPVELSLHRDGRSYYRTQFRIEQDSLVLAPHDFPVKSWWYGHHESLGTLKSFRQGVVHNYTERRLLAFLDWACGKWPADRNRVLVVGVGGGAAGGGAIHLGVRHPEVFCLALSGYGQADYAGEIQALTQVKKAGDMPAQLESIWGKIAWGLKTDRGKNVWDEQNLAKVVKELPEKNDLPLLAVTGYGMLQPMRDFLLALTEKNQPFMARYGVYGGGTILPVSRTGTWSNMVLQEVRKDQATPVFLGAGVSSLVQPAREPAGELVVSDGVKRWWGVMNTEYRWRTDDLVDEPARLEITLFWAGSPSVRKPYADVTIRRVQKFRLRADWQYTYEVRNQAGEVVDSGKVSASPGGLFTVKSVVIPVEGVRLAIRP